MEQRAVIVIPAYNPPSAFVQYCTALAENGFDRIVVVDDGSRTDKLPIFMKLERLGCIILRHESNRGQGAALKTGFDYYQNHFAGQSDGIITLSADRFTRADDVGKIASSLHNEQQMGSYALVAGTRNLDGRLVTDYDYRMGSIMKTLYHMLMGVKLNDPLAVVLGIPDIRVAQCQAVPGDGYSYVTAMTMSFEKIGFLQVPVEYTLQEADAQKSFRRWDTLSILYTIVKKFILYSITSVAASILDLLMFGIFTGITFRGMAMAIIYGTVCARLISASANYLLTKHFVFQFKSDAAQKSARSAGEFLALSVAQCLCSALLVSGLKIVMGGSAVGIKVLVDMTLFFLSYKIQHKYIFKDDGKDEAAARVSSASAGTTLDDGLAQDSHRTDEKLPQN